MSAFSTLPTLSDSVNFDEISSVKLPALVQSPFGQRGNEAHPNYLPKNHEKPRVVLTIGIRITIFSHFATVITTAVILPLFFCYACVYTHVRACAAVCVCMYVCMCGVCVWVFSSTMNPLPYVHYNVNLLTFYLPSTVGITGERSACHFPGSMH